MFVTGYTCLTIKFKKNTQLRHRVSRSQIKPKASAWATMPGHDGSFAVFADRLDRAAFECLAAQGDILFALRLCMNE